MNQQDQDRLNRFAASLIPTPRSGAYIDGNAVETAADRAKAERMEQQARAILRVLQMSVRQTMMQAGLSTQAQIDEAVADASIWFEDEFLPELASAIGHHDAMRPWVDNDAEARSAWEAR